MAKIIGVSKFERLFREAAGLDVDKDDLARASGDTSTGWSVMKVGWTRVCSTVFSKISSSSLPQP